jgi:hypothetical protein
MAVETTQVFANWSKHTSNGLVLQNDRKTPDEKHPQAKFKPTLFWNIVVDYVSINVGKR